MRKLVISILFIVICVIIVYSEEKPRTAVIPFNGVGVSETEAVTASSLFETALVQTDAFLVIEQNQMKEILEAQAFTLSGCTDESCAVEIGKLLAAEQIVLGSFSSLGTGYILNAKIIDVTLDAQCVMIPRKSVSFCLGIGQELANTTKMNSCRHCNMKECPYRKRRRDD